MSDSLTTYVRGVNRPGPKSKAVNLGVHDGVALWVWMPADTIVVPGMTFTCEKVSLGEIQTSYINNGTEVDLKVPRRQVFCYAQAVLGAPEQEAVVTTAVVTDAALEYAEKYLAAQARVQNPGNDAEDAF